MAMAAEENDGEAVVLIVRTLPNRLVDDFEFIAVSADPFGDAFTEPISVTVHRDAENFDLIKHRPLAYAFLRRKRKGLLRRALTDAIPPPIRSSRSLYRPAEIFDVSPEFAGPEEAGPSSAGPWSPIADPTAQAELVHQVGPQSPCLGVFEPPSAMPP